MKVLLLLLTAWASLSQESSLELFVACRAPQVFSDYRNTNFKQEVRLATGGLNFRIKSRSLSLRNLNHRVGTAEGYLAAQGPEVRLAFDQVRLQALSLADYLRNISVFLKNRIEYTEAELPQDAASVLSQRRGHCIGFANVAQALLACVGIASRPVNGFFLREQDQRIEPVPHRWLEIDLPGERRVFYDPQYQDFSSRYLVTNPGVSLESIERFAGVVVRKNKKILDE
ncbi:MAG: transglutaminase-like domain-containing protein [Acidobacteria bacterium]|nr:transglutaminase-like domain-containing protein [Acidobacteriota bacterium]